MIFNSKEFLFVFLPVLTIILYTLYRLKLQSFLIPVVLLASLTFYAFSNIFFVPILALSLIVNFNLGKLVHEKGAERPWYLYAGVLFNVLYIAVFKYTSSLNDLLSATHVVPEKYPFLFPLGISFYTFIQIGFLVDQYEGARAQRSLLNYSLFVTYFPTISSGPITQYEDVGFQLEKLSFANFSWENTTRGITLIIFGMFKKVIIADFAASIANPIFKAVHAGDLLNTFEAWVGALCYSFQIYFDFSGYSDIAIGLAMMMGIRLPWNFNSPYKAINIVDFWRRWHMSLSAWLSIYVFEPVNYAIQKRLKAKELLGISKGMWAYIIGTAVTMILCGLWHGATAVFILWGVLHLAFILTNRLWQETKKKIWGEPATPGRDTLVVTILSRAVTFITVTLAWILFRSDTLDDTFAMWRGMMGANGIFLPEQLQGLVNRGGNGLAEKLHIVFNYNHGLITTQTDIILQLGILSFIVWGLPNTRDIIYGDKTLFNGRVAGNFADLLGIRRGWKPSPFWMILVALMMVSLVTFNKIAEFIYFNF